MNSIHRFNNEQKVRIVTAAGMIDHANESPFYMNQVLNTLVHNCVDKMELPGELAHLLRSLLCIAVCEAIELNPSRHGTRLCCKMAKQRLAMQIIQLEDTPR